MEEKGDGGEGRGSGEMARKEKKGGKEGKDEGFPYDIGRGVQGLGRGNSSSPPGGHLCVGCGEDRRRGYFQRIFGGT